MLNRLVRAQVIKGATTREKGKLVYQIRIENASPMVLNGLALLGTGSPEEETPKVLTGICVSPRRSLTIPARRASRQGVRPQEGDQADGARPERAVISAYEKSAARLYVILLSESDWRGLSQIELTRHDFDRPA